ncbi:MAG: phospholipase A, partial [Melioribacteraceae bacterium]|nr:phospholipase A [Melioribacteraceae bacterium]
MKRLIITLLILVIFLGTVVAQETDEGSNEKASMFWNSFGFHDPMYFSVGNLDHPDKEGKVIASKFQISFLYELFGFYSGNPKQGAPLRGLNFGFTQTSYWDLQSPSEPFYDTSFKPAFFALFQYLGGKNISWVNRIDIEGGFQHHSNGKDGFDSRFIDVLYVKPTFVWSAWGDSYFFVAPKVWKYINISDLNYDIEDYWGYFDLELTWRSSFGLQIETHTWLASEVNTFNVQLTYPLNKLWSPLNFYLFV